MNANESRTTTASDGASNGAAAIEVRGLGFEFGRGEFRLDGFDLSVAPGEKLALVGPSGCGKTTLLNLIAGILPPRQGSIRVGERSLEGASDRERRLFRIRNVGLVFQSFELIEYLRVLDNILLPYRIHPALRIDRDVRERARALAESVGIGDRLRRRIDHLSQGERQRVAICRALLPKPNVVLADEPTGNLDSVNTERILDVLFRRVEEANATLVVVTHDRAILDRFDRVVDMAACATTVEASAGEAGS